MNEQADKGDYREVDPKTGKPWRYARSKTGGTVHRADCHLAAAGQPWHYADGMDPEWMRATLPPWISPCRRCKPLDVTANV